MKKILLTSALIGATLASNTAKAGLDYWVPQGNDANPYTGSLSGSWESALWATATGLAGTPSAFVENNAAAFSFHTGAGTPAFTVTMNANHTIAGYFVTLSGSATNVTVAGTGIATMFSGNLNGVSLNSSNNFSINTTLAGSSTAGFCPEGSGQIYMNTNNNSVGNFYFGYSGASFSGIVNIGHPEGFGHGSNILLNCPGAAIVQNNASGLLVITNPFVNYHVNTYDTNTLLPNNFEQLNIVGTEAGITFAAPWYLSGGGPGAGGSTYATNNTILPSYAQTDIGSSSGGDGDTNRLVTIAGPIYATNAFNKFNAATLALSGTNHILGSLNVSNGILRLTATGSINGVHNLLINSNSYLDVTAYSTWSVPTGARLILVGPNTGVSPSSVGPTLSAGVGGTFDLGTSPVMVDYYDTSTAVANIGQGNLNFNSNSIIISNATGAALDSGYYTLFTLASGTVTGLANASVTVSGAGLVAGRSASLQYVSGQVYLVVNNAGTATTTTLSAPGSIAYGGVPSITATVSPDPSASGGTVQFFDGGIPLGSAVVVTNGGIAVFTNVSADLMVGTNVITAVYSGSSDNVFASSTSTAQNLVVTKATLLVTAKAQTVTYGTAASSATSQVTVSGLAFGDTVSTPSAITLSFGTGYITTNTPVGTYSITPTAATIVSPAGSSYNAANYTVAFAAGTLTVNPLAITITAPNETQTYGTPAVLGTTAAGPAAGFKNGQTTNTIKVTLTSSGDVANAPVGTYAIVPSAAIAAAGNTNFNASNYTITYANGVLTVNPLVVVLTGTRPFDGTATANASILTVSNAVAGDDVSVASGSATLADSAVGIQPITSVGTLALGGVTASNYTLVGATGTVTITGATGFSPFSITSAAVDSTKTNLVVCFQSVNGQVYNVLTNNYLANQTNWADVGGTVSPVTATGTNTCVTIPGITNAATTFVLIKQ